MLTPEQPKTIESRARVMTRYEKIKDMSIEDIARVIIRHDITDDFCKGDCEEVENVDEGCNHDLECCVRWLNEEPQEAECRICGCTDSRACPGGCYWVELDLCSRCAVDVQ